MRPRAGLADAGITDMWFAPGAGLAKWSEITIAGPRSFALTAFSSGTTTGARLRVTMETDRQVYAPGDSVLVRYRLANSTKEILSLLFPSGQTYDLALEGPQGKVWQWSSDKVFVRNISRRYLSPGDTLGFREAFRLPRSGLGQGVYILRGFLAVGASEGGAVGLEETEAKVTFTVGKATETGAQGDFNGDARTDLTDFFLFAMGFGKRSGETGFDRAFDMDGDGEVGFGDFLIFADGFGKAR
jgi:hypothetical protein